MVLYNKEEKIQKLDKQRISISSSQQSTLPQKNSGFISRSQKNKIQKLVINESQIICTTLAMSASDILNCIKDGDFEYLIVDEACQSVELTCLIPFMHEPKKIILVGD